MTTASRSHKLMVRVQDIEAALPPLEKAVLAQTSHLHFCYTAGMAQAHVSACTTNIPKCLFGLYLTINDILYCDSRFV